MGNLFKQKKTVEDLTTELLQTSFPNAVSFLHKENSHAHRPIKLPDATLLEIGSAMLLFFLADLFPSSRPETKEKMGRAFMTAQKIIESQGADADKAYGLWKAFTDGMILSQDEERLRLACRLTWERLFPDKAYKEPSPLHSFGYFLQMEVQAAQKLKIV